MTSQIMSRIYTFILFITVLNIFFGIIFMQSAVGRSMMPTIETESLLVTKKNIFKDYYEKDEIITFKIKQGDVTKRILGVPGDELNIGPIDITINGESVCVIESDYTTYYNSFYFNDIIPDDYYFVVGDNYEFSMDSRDKAIQLIYYDDIKGKVIYHFKKPEFIINIQYFLYDVVNYIKRLISNYV